MNEAVEIREMELRDLPAVFKLGERIFTPATSPSLYRTWDEYELVSLFASDGETCLVAEQGERIVGFATGTIIEKARSAWTYGYLVWLGVDPRLARSGIGHRLLRRLTDLFVEFGARMLLVDTDAGNTPALNFFRREGFGSDQPHVYLSKNLAREHDKRRPRKAARVRPARETETIRKGKPRRPRSGGGD